MLENGSLHYQSGNKDAAAATIIYFVRAYKRVLICFFDRD